MASLLDRLLAWLRRPAPPSSWPGDGYRSAPPDGVNPAVDDGDVEAPPAPWSREGLASAPAVVGPPPPTSPGPPPPGGASLSTLCLSRAQIHAARQRQPGAVPGPMPFRMPCPSREELITLGLFRPTPLPSMTGTNLVSGPYRDDNRCCCYQLSHWSTGRPLLVDGTPRVAPLVRERSWPLGRGRSGAPVRDSGAVPPRAPRGQRPGRAARAR